MPHPLFDGLEVGGNIFELIEFALDRHLPDGTIKTGRYGVNVAKVREVVRMPEINPLASSIPGIAGVFELRGVPIPAINLAVALGDTKAPILETQQIIVTEFSLKRAGFIVKTTDRIRRIAWEKVLPPTADKHTCINGMTLVEDNEFLFILDLEKVLLDIEKLSNRNFFNSTNTHAGSTHQVQVPPQGQQNPATKNFHILLVDDSDIILKNAKIILEREGYHVYAASNGMLAKNILEEYLGGNHTKIDTVITDVEMPKMDGLSLTKWIRDQAKLKDIPVILHTSLSGKANLESGKIVGADAYVIKNDISRLLNLLKDLYNNGSLPA